MSFSIPCNGQNSCETAVTVLGESENLVLLSVTIEATCFANVLSVARCVPRSMFHQLVTPFSRRFRDKLRDRLHCISVIDTSVYLVSYDGLLVKTRTHKLSLLSLYLYYCVKKKIKKI